eukprot:CAMPEP_0198244466 /NCGR_PEP_ID=MMETSP1446-20131203/35195_1 /TAXON_ID=1461542 ORGANISM="Unidentified sp, Strain CCMP2111" /NCGR_SAMPLE_ID=MMETSP1446 /ASSEMBLY_ACC=CAM_ASM_001112 /LENGTH=972 /DNA_ID=CAMNT_0043928507 /DNA_START=138 /DNA_END=3059 /DNA_ORIENTATION=+
MAASGSFRGLQIFINDIKQCQSKEAELSRVDKELANIRTKFKSDKGLSSYEKKKYIWKLLYIYVLGYEVEFGHMEALSLISSTKFSEKEVGYIAASVLLNENLEFVRLVINTMQKDLVSGDENFQCMALAAIANMGGKEFAEALGGDVQKILVSSLSRPIVRKKAALCLLRLFRRNPDIISADSWAGRMSNLLQERDLGVLLSSMSLLCGLVASDPTGYEIVIPRVVQVLERLARGHDIPQDYTYYGIPSPWLHIKALRVLHYFPVIDNDTVLHRLVEILEKTITNTPADNNVNKNNALHAILFESISLMMHLQVSSSLLEKCVGLLGKFVIVKEPNIRYLGLESMSRLSLVPEMMAAIRSHQEQITVSLHDPDISIRKRALDLLYGMCNATNSREIVEQLLDYLTTADFMMREELTLKIAILSEKFASSQQWYVDVILSLIDKAGAHVSDEVWYRVVQIVTNNESLQVHAAQNVLRKLKDGSSHETMLKVASYILGEFGHLLQESQMDIFHLLKDHFMSAGSTTKGLVLSAFAKILARSSPGGELAEAINGIFRRYGSIPDAELQQRAVEYAVLAGKKEAPTVLAAMPKFPERESSLVKLVEANNDGTESTLPLQRERRATSDAQPISTVEDLLGGLDEPAQTANGSAQAVSDPLDLLGSAVQAPTSTAVNVNDMLADLSVTNNQPQAPVPQQQQQPAAVQGDIFGGALPDIALDSTASTSLSPQLVGGTLEQWFSKLSVSNRGVLYQDQYLQIGLKAEFRGHQGQMTLFLGNKHMGDLTDCIISIPPTSSYRIQVGGPTPKVIAAQTQAQVLVSVSCVDASAASPPVLQLVYHVNGQRAQATIPLPIIPSKFFTPVTNVDANTFFSQWKSIPGPPAKVQEIRQCAVSIPVERVHTLFQSVGLGVAQGLDPNLHNIVGVAGFTCETSSNTIVMVRLELDPKEGKQFRVTVASNNPALSASTKELLLRHLTA